MSPRENSLKIRAAFFGILASSILLAVYFFVLTSLNDWTFARDQFRSFWYFILALAIGFGIQVSLFTYLKNSVHRAGGSSGKVLAVSGTTSTAAMISCCAHYLVNLVPILGISGFLSVAAQYQTQFFWVGLAFNLFGIAYVGRRVMQFRKQAAL